MYICAFLPFLLYIVGMLLSNIPQPLRLFSSAWSNRSISFPSFPEGTIRTASCGGEGGSGRGNLLPAFCAKNADRRKLSDRKIYLDRQEREAYTEKVKTGGACKQAERKL